MARYCFRYSAENAVMRSGIAMAIDAKTAAQPAFVDREQYVAPGSGDGDSGILQKHCDSPIDAPD